MRPLRGVGGVWSRIGRIKLLLLATIVVVAVMVWTGLAGGTQPYETYESTVAADGPVAQYRFDDTVGSSTLADSVGAYTASNSGIVLGGEGPFGGSKSGAFGGEAFATLPSDPLAGASAFTAEGWVDWAGGASYKQPVFDFGSSSTNYMYLTPASALSSHKMLFEIHTAAGGVEQVTTTKLKASTWEYLAVTETSSGTLTLYLNGEQVGQSTGATIFPASLGSAPEDYLGKSVVSGEPLFDGSLSNVAFYTKALTAGQILARYNSAEFPVNTVAATITGTPKDGDTLTAHAGTWSGLTPITFSYQWTRCNSGGGECSSITAATGSTYLAGHEDVGRTLRVAVGASNSGGSGSATSAQTGIVAAIKPANTALPVVSGVLKIGRLLSASTGSWSGSPATYSYQWQTCNNLGAKCANITGATGSTYRLIPYDIVDTIRVIVTATNSAGSASATSELTGLVAFGEPVNVTPPSVSGTVRDGQTLTAASGSWAGTEPITYAYQWQTCNASGESCTNITGATGSTFLLGPSDVGSTLRVLVTATNAIGHTSEPSPATAVVAAIPPSNTAPPSITGTTTDGRTLTASTGAWSGTPPLSYGYAWERCNSSGESCASISGATSSTYTLRDADVGDTLRVTVTASNSGGSASATSAASGVVLRAPSNTAAPVVSGTPQQGQTLTASTGAWVGTEPISYAYQWESCNSLGEGCLDVSGATTSTYALGAGDVGNTLRVAVTASNAAGSASATSAASAVVTASSTCTDTWTGEGGSSWQTSGSWSTGVVPTSSDRACIPAGKTVNVTSGSEVAGSIMGEGGLGISGGSLELADASHTSSIGSLSLRNGTLSGAGTLDVTSSFDLGAYGVMSGSGATVLGPEVTAGEIYASSGCEEIRSSRKLVNEGTVTFRWGTVFLEGTRFENKGTFNDNSEATCFGPEILSRGSGTASVLNTGTFQKTASGGTSTVDVNFSNQGAVKGLAGTLDFSDGGVAAEPAYGSWTVQGGGSIVLSGGTFLVGGEVDLSAVSIQGATVTRATAPSSTSAPTTTGEPFVGQTLSASTGVWSGLTPISYSYQWQDCNTTGGECANIAGATASTYVLAGGDAGRRVQVLVTATNSLGSAAAASQPTAVVATALAPSNTAPPTISGNAHDGQTLSASTGTWTATPEPSYHYQWERCNTSGEACTPIASATASTYTLGHEDVGSTVRVRVEARNLAGSASSTSQASTIVAAAGPSNVLAPAVSGVAQEGQTLRASTGEWAGTPPITYRYQWESCDGLGEACMPIPGATSATYTVGPAEVNGTVRVVVSATNSVSSASETSVVTSIIAGTPPSNTTPPAITGVAEEGEVLSASTGVWSGTGPVEYSYQWESCSEHGEECAEAEGATGSTYQLGAGDVGTTLRVTVIASSPWGVTTATSPASAIIATPLVLPVNLASPEITGAPQAGQALDASVGSWAGPPPLSYSYQWESCDGQGEQCADVAGATGSIYQLAAGDLGSTLRVLVTASDGNGRASRVSPASAVIEEAPASGSPSQPTTCTDTWVGASTGKWAKASNWSTGHTPTASDIACIPSGVEVDVEEGTFQVAAVHDQGTLEIHSVPFGAKGTLELTSTSEPSNVATLRLSGILTGPGTLQVTSALEWSGQKMTGTGRTIIEPSATGTLKGGLLSERTLVNEGTITFAQNYLEMTEGALLENRGTFVDNAEDCPCGMPGQIFVKSGTVIEPTIVNTGTFEKTEGTGTSIVAVPFTNDGTVSSRSGTLKFAGGGAPGQAATGAWSAENSAAIVFASGTYLIGETVNLSAVTVEAGAHVERTGTAPALTSPPTVSGSAQAGQTLSAAQGTWSGSEPISYAYQWQTCNTAGSECQPIAGATSTTYTLPSSEAGSTIRVSVTASNTHGQASALSAATATVQPPPAPSNTALPAISGTAQDGQTLSASTGTWGAVAPVSYSYQWESCNPAGEACVPVEGATGATYQLGEGDIATQLRVVATATNPGGSTAAVSSASATIAAEPPSELQPPSISGTPDVHNTFSANPGVWTGSETQLSYQWESCNPAGEDCAPVEGATSPEYDLGEGDLGTTLRVRVGANSTADSISDISPQTAVIGDAGALAAAQPPFITGAPQVGQALTANRGSFSATATYTYQWQTCNELATSCQNIEGAISTSYVPTGTDTGHRLRIQVTATSEHTAVTQTSPVTQPVAGALAPVIEQAPPINGPALAGQTLTAGTGVFAAAGPVSYTYQWERCSGGGSCQAIEGATNATYTPTESDTASTLIALVQASDTNGATTAVSLPTAIVQPEALQELSPPSITGVVQSEGTLSAHPGIWSAAGLVSYTYQWERCNSAGEDCAAITGATEATYHPAGGDLGSTLRVTVTATSPHGSQSAHSAHTPSAISGEVNVAEAQEVAQRTDPDLLAASTTATLEEQSIAPSLTDTGEELASQNALTTSTISKETAGEFAVNTPIGELSLTPVESLPAATTPATIVNGAAALFTNTWPATDTIIRPQPLGAATILQIRSPEAPHSFSWELRLGPDQELKQLPNGSAAVIEAAEEPTRPTGGQGAGENGPLRTTSEGPAETSEEKAQAEQEESQPETEEEVPLESLPASPQSTTATGEAGAGQPQPQQTQTAYETATTAMASAEAQTAGKALIAITPPTVTDAQGHAVPASLSVTGNTLTLTIKPGTGAPYPLLADTTIAAPKASATRNTEHFGISDPDPKNAEGHLDQHLDENDKPLPGFDPNLANPKGPLGGIKTARLVVPYDTLTAKTPYAASEKQHLENSLEKIGKAHLQPFITIGKDFSTQPCGEKHKNACARLSAAQYKKGTEQLMKDLIKGNAKKGFPPVELWGAWNEPDAGNSPLHRRERLAAEFWEIAQSTMARLTKHVPCPHCGVVAGEFAFPFGFEKHYTTEYRKVLLCSPTRERSCKRYWSSLPALWGFHDYYDVVERKKETAESFERFIEHSRSKPRIFMSEAGVLLQNGAEPSFVKDQGQLVELEKFPELQVQAAETFLHLHEGPPHLPHIDREYYYMYTAPTPQEIKAHEFDSALLEVPAVGHLQATPAYCVLAYTKHICPPAVEAHVNPVNVGFNRCNIEPKFAEVTGHITPGTNTFSYHLEYGPTSTYGESTVPQNMTVPSGLTAVEIHGEVPVTRFEETANGRCPTPIHVRLVATNAQATSHSSHQTITFTFGV